MKKKKFKILGNQRGMSLVEVMGAAALSVIISFAVMKTNQTGQQGMAKVSTDIDFDLWRSGVLYKELGNNDVCTQNFSGIPDVSSDVTTIGSTYVLYKALRDANWPSSPSLSTNPLVQVGANIGVGDTWEVASAVLRAYNPDGPGLLNGTCQLEVTLNRNRKALGPTQKVAIATLDCTVDQIASPSTIQSCVLSGGDNTAIWNEANDHIWYDGNVVVGASTPPVAALTINERPLDATSTLVEWPVGSGSGVAAALNITNSQDVILFGGLAGFRLDSNCIKITRDRTGALMDQTSFCTSGNTILNDNQSAGSNFITGGSNSSILGGSNVSITQSDAATHGSDISIGLNSYAFGENIVSTHTGTFTIGRGDDASGTYLHSHANDQFTGAFDNGYRFFTQRLTANSSAQYAARENSGVYISSTGIIGIGRDPDITTPVGGVKLIARGHIYSTGSVYADSFLYTSDRRHKKNIKRIDSALEKVSKLEGVFFEWKSNSELEMGFIAQDVEKVFPLLVNTDSNGFKSVKYGNITAVLVESVKELKAENEALKSKVDFLMRFICEQNKREGKIEEMCQN